MNTLLINDRWFRLVKVSKILSILIMFVTIGPVIVFGKFQNEFLRINIIFSSIIFTFFANEHYLIRLVVRILTIVMKYRP